MLEFDARCRLGSFALEAAFRSEGRVTALFGRSGAGKSTVLNLIAGLARPSSGRIAIDGRTLYDGAAGVDLAPHARRIGYVFQEGRLLPHLTVRQNLLYGRFFSGNRQRAAATSLDQAIALLGIAPLLERRPAALSGGERQRVAIGRALLAQPSLLLLDEPLAALDAPRKAEILYYIERLRDEVGVPIVYVSHSLDELVRIADRVVLLSEGRVLAAGTIHEMSARIELRPYLGRHEGGAVIEARVAAQDLESGLARLEFAGGVLQVPDVEALAGENVRVRIRARDVSIALEPPSGVSILNVLPGTVAELGAADGSSLDVRIDIGGSPVIARITRHSAARLALAPGKRVFAMIKAVSLDRRSVGYA
ncbi:MAG TPA: molybdenum ABC transporter ATP-binding protein [Burkholderiales bacterium]|nr:molybdenum ABC transporter ATP-binding protein [Burkholderiales bacterium]